MTNTFNELYKNDNQIITPSDELLTKISERVKSEIDSPTRLFWIKTQSVSRLVSAAAAVIIIAAAITVPVIQNNINLKSDNQNADEAASIDSVVITEQSGETSEISETEDANKLFSAVLFEDIEDNEIYDGSGGINSDNSSDNSTSTQAADSRMKKEEFAWETTETEKYEDVAADDDEEYYEEDDADYADYDEDAVDDAGDADYEDDEDDDADYADYEDYEDDIYIDYGDVDIKLAYVDYYAYIYWPDSSVWNNLKTKNNTPPKTVLPDNWDVADSMEIPNGKTELKTFREFTELFFTNKHMILTAHCTDKTGVYPSDYAINNPSELFSPVYSLMNNYLDSEIQYNKINNVMPYSPYIYSEQSDSVIMFDIQTGRGRITMYITENDKMIFMKENSYSGEYVLQLETGTYIKMWNYINSHSDYHILYDSEADTNPF